MNPIDPMIFFVVMVVLQIADGWTTYTLHKLAAADRQLKFKELNPILRKIMEWVGVEEALWIVKLIVIVSLWINPVTSIGVQIAAIVGFVIVVASNYTQVKKFKK